MTSLLFEPADAWDHRLAASATGLLGVFNRAGVLTAAEVHVADRAAVLAGEADDTVRLAMGLAVRAVTHGSVGVDLASVADTAPDLPWPEPTAWQASVAASPLLDRGVLRSQHGLLYLDRYHRLEVQVCDDLVARADQPAPVVDETALGAALDRIFPAGDYPEQREAAASAARRWTSVLTGGPGTGKTTTVAGLIALLTDQADRQGRRLSVALTAPTGKAAARLQESVLSESERLGRSDAVGLDHLQSMTLHRLLGWRPDNSTRFRHDRGNRLKYDVVVVDEASMVDLMMVARLLEALRPDARLVLVGDPDQLTSVGAGAVLSDLVAGYADAADSPVLRLRTTHRYGAEIGRLAGALRAGDADEVLAALRGAGRQVELVESADPGALLKPELLASAAAIAEAAARGDVEAALRAVDRHRLICAHRDGPHGVAFWNRQVERWLAEEAGVDYWPVWYSGRPLLVTSNDYGLRIYNGETGAVVRRDDGALRAVISGSDGPVDLAPGRLGNVDTMHALTVHKSQGGQADRVTVLMPPEDSRLLTRELFYTAITRARRKVRVVGTEAEIRAAVDRRAVRATGLRARLRAAID